MVLRRIWWYFFPPKNTLKSCLVCDRVEAETSLAMRLNFKYDDGDGNMVDDYCIVCEECMKQWDNEDAQTTFDI